MNPLLDGVLVGAVLLAAVVYAAAKLGPKAWRKRILGESEGACGGCESCGTESASAPQSSTEISVPVAKIGRRA
jgi:hypothetical protein